MICNIFSVRLVDQVQIKWGLNFFILDSRRVLVGTPSPQKVLGSDSKTHHKSIWAPCLTNRSLLFPWPTGTCISRAAKSTTCLSARTPSTAPSTSNPLYLAPTTSQSCATPSPISCPLSTTGYVPRRLRPHVFAVCTNIAPTLHPLACCVGPGCVRRFTAQVFRHARTQYWKWCSG